MKSYWKQVGKQKIINLDNANQQYKELGYPHRNILILQCQKCKKTEW